MSLAERLAIREFETLAEAIVLRGHYKPGGDSGASLRTILAKSHPALYPHVDEADRVDVAALMYVLRRLPDQFWNVRQITVSREVCKDVQDDFPMVRTEARRRPTYKTGEGTYATALRGGTSDLLDFMSAVTCFQIEADKIRAKHAHYRAKRDEDDSEFGVWDDIENLDDDAMEGDRRHGLLHALSVEFHASYADVKALDAALRGNLPELTRAIVRSGSKDLKIIFADAFGLVADYGTRARAWAAAVCRAVETLGLGDREVFVVSSNLHSMVNCLSPYVRERARAESWQDVNDYERLRQLLYDDATAEARVERDEAGGIYKLDTPEHMPVCQLIDLARVESDLIDDRVPWGGRTDGILLNMDYAFGEEGFFLFNELLEILGARVRGIYIMGKAGSLVGDRGDVMLPTFFVKLGSGDVYDVHNCMTPSDFDGFAGLDVRAGGPMLTVAGTFLQNRVALSYFRDRWNALGVEMEGTPYARALAQARLRGRISEPVCIGVAYYASDAPLASDLLSEPLREEGARAVYAVTIAILRNVLRQES